MFSKQKSQEHGNLRFYANDLWVLAVTYCLAAGIGIAAVRSVQISVLFVAAFIVVFCYLCRLLIKDWGCDDLSISQFLMQLLLDSPILVCFALLVSIYDWPENLQGLCTALTTLLAIVLVVGGARHGIVIGSTLAYAVLVYRTYNANDPRGIMWATAIICLIPSFFTMYRRDFLLLLCLHYGYLCVIAAGLYGRSWSRAVLYSLLGACWFYVFFVYGRRKRQLPSGLRGAKFIKLGYLRHLAATGKPIRRMQDLPPQAFGDYSKAWHVLAISHHWLDRYTCDSEGLHLNIMVNRLDEYFSLKGFFAGQSLWQRLWRMRASTTSGWDVVVFFDFMSLPQIGLTEQGEEIPRTPEEETIFFQCLPHMSLLYSSFPVLILEDAEGRRKYEDSGWCFSEFHIAYLGGMLDPYSSGHMARVACRASFLGTYSSGHMASVADICQFEKTVDINLAMKSFFFDADRDIVKKLFHDFLRKRRLVLAIHAKQVIEVHAILSEIDGDRRWALLDQSVDAIQNTALHIAVCTGCLDVVRVLLSDGADPDILNLRGDRPWQWFGWPRMQAAARFLVGKKVMRQQPSWIDEEVAITNSDNIEVSTWHLSNTSNSSESSERA